MTKPWQLNPVAVEASAEIVEPVWLPPTAGDNRESPAKADETRHSKSLTPDEWRQYFETSRRIAEARVAAENFERAMRRDFAERRLKRLQQA